MIQYKKKNNAVILIIAMGIILLFIFVFILNNGRTTVTENSSSANEYKTLICTRSYENNTDLFYTNSDTVREEIKSAYANDSFQGLNMTYFGEYASEIEASKAETKVHSAYNEYTGSLKISNTKFSPTYSVIDKTMKMNLYVDAKNNIATAPRAFFLETSIGDQIDMKMPNLKQLYETQGFSCVIQNNKKEFK